MLWNCGAGEDSWESIGQQGNQTSKPLRKWTLNTLPLTLKLKLQYFGLLMQIANSLEKIPCWEKLKAGEEGERGWDGWRALSTQWTWTWANSERWWGTGKPGVLQLYGLVKCQTQLGDRTTTMKTRLLCTVLQPHFNETFPKAMSVLNHEFYQHVILLCDHLDFHSTLFTVYFFATLPSCRCQA